MLMIKITQRIKLLGVIVVTALIIAFSGYGVEIINAGDCGVRPDSGADMTTAVRDALQRCEKQGAERLAFAPGRYDFFPVPENIMSTGDNRIAVQCAAVDETLPYMDLGLVVSD